MDLMKMDDFFDDFLPYRRENNMKCDIYEKDNKYYIDMDIPGFNKEDIDISLKNGYLTIKAERKKNVEEENDDKTFIRRERSYAKTERSFNLGNVDEDNIDASFKDGVLSIVIPKAEEEKKLIEIH